MLIGESFSADTSPGDEERILLFGRQSVEDWIERVEKIYVDGTFSLAPHLFYQIVVILAEREGFVLPICYALLPSKTEHCYNRMMQLIRRAWPALKPKAISTDFEIALMRSRSAVYPDAQLQGCFFTVAVDLSG